MFVWLSQCSACAPIHSLECPTLLNIHLLSFLQITTQIPITPYHHYQVHLQKMRKRDHPHLSSNALQVSGYPMISLKRSSPSLLPYYNSTLENQIIDSIPDLIKIVFPDNILPFHVDEALLNSLSTVYNPSTYKWKLSNAKTESVSTCSTTKHCRNSQSL